MHALFEAIQAADFAGFRREWDKAGMNAPGLKDETTGHSVYEETVSRFNLLVKKALCSDVFLPRDAWKWAELLSGFQAKLKGVTAILHFLRQERRITRAHRDGLQILVSVDSPFLFFALLNAGETPHPSDPLSARETVLEKILQNDKLSPDSEPKRQWLLLKFIIERIADAVDALGRRCFRPSPATAQHFLAMSFILGSPRFFKYCCQVPGVFSAADLYNWDLTLHALQTAGLPEYLCPLAAARVRCSLASGVAPSVDLRYVTEVFIQRVTDLFGKGTAEALRFEVSVARGIVPHGLPSGVTEVSAEDYLAGQRGREKRLAVNGF